MRLIDADALKREMWRRCGETDIEIDKGRAKWDSGLWIRYKVFEECIADAPAIEAEPIRHGQWLYIRDEENNGLYECSECHKGDIHAKECEVPYCWNCGARMDLGEVEKCQQKQK